MLGIMFLVVIPILVLMRRPKMRGGGVPVH
jgi:preprotein translocase subunit SecG